MTSATERLRRFLSPWWAVVWFVASIVWLIGFNILYIEGGATNEWWGIISIIPVWSFTAYVIVSGARSRKRVAESREWAPGR